MKAEEFVQALNGINERYIEEAARYRKRGGSLKLWRGIAIAACACLAVSALFSANALYNGGRFSDSYSQTASAPQSMKSDMSAEYGEAVYEEVMFEDDMAMYEPAEEEAVGAYDGGVTGSPALNAAAAVAQDASSERFQPKIIHKISMDMQTKNFDDAVSGIESAVAAFDGYCESQNIYNRSRSYRSAAYVIRIPAERLEDFVRQVGDISTVTYISRSAEDVSDAYYDTESRLTTARTKLARLQELLSRAEDMADIITIESAISDTEWEIDNYSGALNYMDSRVSYSTVNLNLEEVYEVVVEEAPSTFGEKLSLSFSQGLRDFGNAMQELVFWIANSWIVLLILAAVVVAVVLIIRGLIRRRRK